MDLRMWGFITFPKESTASACPSLVSLGGGGAECPGSRKVPDGGFAGVSSHLGVFASGCLFWLGVPCSRFSVSSGGSSIFTQRIRGRDCQVSWV